MTNLTLEDLADPRVMSLCYLMVDFAINCTRAGAAMDRGTPSGVLYEQEMVRAGKPPMDPEWFGMGKG